MSDFESYLREHKEQFNTQEVNPTIWSNIEQKTKKSHRKNRKLLWISTCLIILTGGALGYLFLTKKDTPSIMAGLPSEKAKTLLIKSQKIQSIPVSNEYKNQLQLLLDQVHYLDKLYESTFQYLHNSSNKHDMAKSQLEYYQAKSELLDKVLFEIEKINNNEKEFNINSDKSRLVY